MTAPRPFNFLQRHATVSGVIATAVTSPAGTFTVPYPSGYDQNSAWGTSARLVINDNDEWLETDDKFDISYGASVITVTNKTLATIPAGSTYILEADLTDLVTPTGVTTAVTALTDSSGGVAADTIAVSTGSYVQATNAAQLASLARKINQLRTALVNAGIVT